MAAAASGSVPKFIGIKGARYKITDMRTGRDVEITFSETFENYKTYPSDSGEGRRAHIFEEKNSEGKVYIRKVIFDSDVGKEYTIMINPSNVKGGYRRTRRNTRKRRSTRRRRQNRSLRAKV